MILGISVAVTLISCPVHGSLPNTKREYPLMHYSKLISEEYFTAPLLIVLPLAEEGTTNEEVGYLIEEMHTSVHWPIQMYNVGGKMNGNMYTEIKQHGIYILLIAGPCNEWQEHISRCLQQL